MSSVGRRLEQLVARKGLDDVDDGLGVVALRGQPEVLDDALELAPQQRDFARAACDTRSRSTGRGSGARR